MGFDDQGIVALSGAHTLGRAFPERSGFGTSVTLIAVTQTAVFKNCSNCFVPAGSKCSFSANW
jgi:Peroxidase